MYFSSLLHKIYHKNFQKREGLFRRAFLTGVCGRKKMAFGDKKGTDTEGIAGRNLKEPESRRTIRTKKIAGERKLYGKKQNFSLWPIVKICKNP